MSDSRAPVELTITDDRMAVLLSCDFPEDAGYEDLVRDLQTEMHAHGLPELGTRERLESLLREVAHAGSKARQVTILKGIPPVEGKDGYAAWTEDFFSTDFCVNAETGNIDYRRRVAQTSVHEGQKLAQIIPPVPGKRGVNVFGEAIAPPKPKAATIRAGKNVEFREDEAGLYATINGRIRIDGDRVSVDDVIEIPDSVGLKSGDVDHAGAVVVHKDIETGASLSAEGDVEVYGLIDGANVTAGGNLLVHSGIIGRPNVYVRVKGSVHARFVNECHMEADGDVTVEREIVNSEIKTRGQLYAPTGVIVGGEIIALGGVVAAEIGSPGYVRTVIRAGTDYQLASKLAELDARRKELIDKRSRIDKSITPYIKQIRSGELTRAQKEKILPLVSAEKEIRAEIESIQVRQEVLRIEALERTRYSVQVTKSIHPETVLFFEREHMHFRDPLLGPIIAKLVKDRIALQ